MWATVINDCIQATSVHRDMQTSVKEMVYLLDRSLSKHGSIVLEGYGY